MEHSLASTHEASEKFKSLANGWAKLSQISLSSIGDMPSGPQDLCHDSLNIQLNY